MMSFSYAPSLHKFDGVIAQPLSTTVEEEFSASGEFAALRVKIS